MLKLLCFAPVFLFSYTSFSQAKRILIVSTNIDSVGCNISGTYLMEIAFPFQYFIDKGYTVDIVTPKGGKASVYHNGKISDELYNASNNALFVSKIASTLSPDQVDAKKYTGIYFPGGHGQFWDVVTDERIAAITSTIYEKGGIIGSAGHGTAALIDVRLKNGRYLVENKKMTCFPWWTEKEWMVVSNYGKLLPFDMETVLARRGANLIVSTKETMKDTSLTRISGARLVTASFASSAKWVAEEMDRLASL